MYLLKSEKANYSLNIPTDKSEITPDVLSKLTEHIKLSKNYAVIALIYRTSPFDLVMGGKSNSKNQVLVSVSPVLAKFNGDLEGKIGDKVSISQTDLQLGLNVPGLSKLEVENVRGYINSDDALNKSVINRTAFADTKFIYLLEFKIVSLNSIKAVIDGKPNDPFIV